MNLIKINLLPYREMREARQKRDFNIIMAIGAAAGVAVAAAIYTFLDQSIANQESRNSTLKAGMTQLEAKLKTIQELETQKHNFLERKRKVEELDHKRFEGARIVDSLNQIVPDGSYLIALKGADGKNGKAGNEYVLEGKALTDNKIAALMAALPSTGIFDIPDLGEIQKTEDSQKFTLKSVLVEQVYVPKAATKSSAAPASAPAAPAN